jgi:hypothetical protein
LEGPFQRCRAVPRALLGLLQRCLCLDKAGNKWVQLQQLLKLPVSAPPA